MRDFLLLSENFGRSNVPATDSVPESGGGFGFAAALLLLGYGRARRAVNLGRA